MATTTLTPQAATYRRSWILEWLTTVDHKKIGIMYIANSFIFFIAAGLLALVMRSELAVPGLQFLDDRTYNEAFTMHGTIMIFLFVVPVLAGFANYIVPLQLGAPDMAFPRINALSFWLLPVGGLMILSGYLFGGAAAEGWTGYTPLSSAYAPGAGTDLWLIGLILVGTASILGSVNFIATIFKMRAPGMTLFRMPIFVWTVLVTMTLILLATPVLTAGLIALFIDRNYGGSFFEPSPAATRSCGSTSSGSSATRRSTSSSCRRWAWSARSCRSSAASRSLAIAPSSSPRSASACLSFSVWAHHMFTTGQVFLPFFSFMTAPDRDADRGEDVQLARHPVRAARSS